MNRFVLLAWALAVPTWAWAHGDEDHGAAQAAAASAPAPASAMVSAAQRLSSQTDQFELVGVLEGRVLRLYLDRYGSNAPVAKAQIEIESGTWKAVATEVAPAVYTVAAEPLTRPGKHALTMTVQAGDVTDLLDATLEVGPASAVALGSPPARVSGTWVVWSGAVVLALAALGFIVGRRRHAARQSAPL